MIGQVLDKYEVLQKLGEGATATVYRGRHTTIGKDVAIKVLHPHLTASTRNRERFNREARAVGRLSHQNIVSILDYSGSQTDDCYIVTELVDGVTLLQLIEEHGSLPSELAAMLGAELCAALGFAHQQGVIHRDIKPENVMIRRDGRVKLMDFGVARVLDEGAMTLDGSLLGSPAYMSPQQALDQQLDGRSDLFSLGTVLFHAVTGSVPFSGSNTSVILRNVIDGNRAEILELNPRVSPRLAGVIDRLLAPNPDDRYPTAEEARAALVACLDEVDLPPDHPTIHLRALIATPKECLAALDAHLRTRLLEKGRERLDANDALGALQLLNRLLAIDEDNAEVIALVQSLHQAPAGARRSPWLAVAGALALLLGGLGAWWWLNRPIAVPSEPETSAPTAASAAPAAPAVAPPPAADSPAAPPSTPATTSPTPSSPRSRVTSPVLNPELAATRLPPVPPPAATPETGKILLSSTGEWAEVWVDGARVGVYRDGPAKNWVGTADAPLVLPAGAHRVEFRNTQAEPQVVDVDLAAGETQRLRIALSRKPVYILVNPRLPKGCSVTVGSTSFGTMRDFELHNPDPATPVVFDCPAPYGRWSDVLGPTLGLEQKILPSELPTP